MANYQSLKCYVSAQAGINPVGIWCRFVGPGETIMVSMRVLAALGVGLSAITGGAQASSIVVL
ncbi:hypothetical protein, partial [Mesorhizobium sp. M4A.F.Ca.ET.050.02.1.1]|uniref:hypothetical protein n=1 Tax=Mesorhizobium sp. M4A.F.Ca.ET.050.02.1.1 TaxID=2496754 RepID=UPI001AECEB5B